MRPRAHAHHLIVFAALASVLSACDNAEELPPDLEGVDTLRVDATSEDEWVYMDLDAPEVDDQRAGWDLKFKRYRVRTNVDAGVSVATVEGKGITEVTEPPDGEYHTDTGDDEDEAGQAFSEYDHWYAYDISVHKLSPRERTYVIESDRGAFYKLQFKGYYDDDGVSGNPTFYWAPFE